MKSWQTFKGHIKDEDGNGLHDQNFICALVTFLNIYTSFLCDNDFEEYFQSQPTRANIFYIMLHSQVFNDITVMDGDSIWHSHSKFTFLTHFSLEKYTQNFSFKSSRYIPWIPFMFFTLASLKRASFCRLHPLLPSHFLIYHRVTKQRRNMTACMCAGW